MDKDVAINLIYNITILLTLALIYSVFQTKNRIYNLFYKIVLGFLNGGAGLLIMSSAMQLEKGVIFDARSILISVSGMFFGAVPTLIAGLIMITYRIIIGGPGVIMGVLVILTTGSIGILWHRYRFENILESKFPYNLEFYLLGLIVHIDMLLCMFALPKDLVRDTLESMFFPVIILYPMGSYLLCSIFLTQIDRYHLLHKLAESEEKYRQIAENTTDVIWTTDLELNITYISPSIERLFGGSCTSYVNRTLEEKFPPQDLNKLKLILEEELEKDRDPDSDKNRSRIIEVRQYRADGSTSWISMHISFMRNENGTVIGLNGISRDINELKKIETEKARQSALLVSLIDSIPDLIFYKDIQGIYLGCNDSFEKYTGKSKKEIIGKTDYELFPWEVADSFKYHDGEMLKYNRSRHNEEGLIYPDGRKVLVDTLKTPYWDYDGNLIGILGISRDITDRKQKEEEIYHIAYHDHLTGLYNRRFYEEELRRINVRRNMPLTIGMGDVNGLKVINDSFGHTVGDELLKKAAEIIKKSCRADDIIARLGGDEFVLLLPQTSSAEAEKIVERIHELSSKEKINGLDISISFGHETKIKETEAIDDIIKNAEDKMYRNKIYETASWRSKTIDLIMNTLYEKNNREMFHSKRVSRICEEIAIHMNLGKSAVEKIKLAGLVHDIGKIGIDEKILNNPNKLNEDEWYEMKKHSEIGYRILMSAKEFSEIAKYVLEHQEKWDGSGYPNGLKGQEISLEARIISVADAFDAMTGIRTYGQVLTIEEALEEIRRCAGKHFDPGIAKLFVEKVAVSLQQINRVS
ncbi:PAS domain S-box protein [Desulfitobacterium sp. Sab5]|uniref:PAS domain S-box protein n=1 Tax=Desulfitobacterium nosdiversum TaxID=3375356 RepID=UPI003CE9600D